jgi:hypothetical protein
MAPSRIPVHGSVRSAQGRQPVLETSTACVAPGPVLRTPTPTVGQDEKLDGTACFFREPRPRFPRGLRFPEGSGADLRKSRGETAATQVRKHIAPPPTPFKGGTVTCHSEKTKRGDSFLRPAFKGGMVGSAATEGAGRLRRIQRWTPPASRRLGQRPEQTPEQTRITNSQWTQCLATIHGYAKDHSCIKQCRSWTMVRCGSAELGDEESAALLAIRRGG